MMRFSRNVLPARMSVRLLASGAPELRTGSGLGVEISKHGDRQALACAGVAGEEDILAFQHQLLHPFLRRHVATHGRTMPAHPASATLPRVCGIINVVNCIWRQLRLDPPALLQKMRVSMAAVTGAHLLIRQLRAGGLPRAVLHSNNRRQAAVSQLLLRALLEFDVRPGGVNVAGRPAVVWTESLRLVVLLLLVVLDDRSAASDT